jgi:acetyltransferase-like isoleucine patch superfamily enzyme
MRPFRRWRFASFGPESFVHRPLWVARPHRIAIGAQVQILHHAWLAVGPWARDDEAPVLIVGDRVGFRTNCTISANEPVVIEDDVIVGAHCSIVGDDHVVAHPTDNVLRNPLRTAPIRIGRGTWIGDRVAILAGTDIGCFCAIGANSVVRGSIPDYSVAVGAPARVVGSTRAAPAAA